jgi:hypothetical protein
MVRLLGKGTAQYGKDGKRGSMLADAFCLLKGVVAAIVFWMLVDLLLPSRTAPPAPSASVVYHTPALPVVAPLQARPTDMAMVSVLGRWWREAERHQLINRERVDSYTLQTLQDPILKWAAALGSAFEVAAFQTLRAA